jgi:HTH-type transcriptional regulator / antitoxin MqsA
MRCAICDGTARLVREGRERRIGRRKILVKDEFYRCEACSEEFFTPEQAQASDRRAAQQLRERHGTLLPEEIRTLRERLGLTQAQFEALLGVGPYTVVRWENGHVRPNAATNALLRLLASDGANVRRLAEWHAVRLTDAA